MMLKRSQNKESVIMGRDQSRKPNVNQQSKMSISILLSHTTPFHELVWMIDMKETATGHQIVVLTVTRATFEWTETYIAEVTDCPLMIESI